MSKSREREKTLTIRGIKMRAKESSALGQVIAYLQNSATDTQHLVREILLICYLPYVIDESDPEYKKKCLESILKLRAMADEIEAFTGFQVQKPQIYSPLASVIQETSEEVWEDDDDDDDEQRYFDEQNQKMNEDIDNFFSVTE